MPLSDLVHEFSEAPDPGEALNAFSRLPGCLLLESSRQSHSPDGKHLGRYSFLMADPFEWVECFKVEQALEKLAGLDELAQSLQLKTLPDLPPFQGGIAGLFSYDLNRAFENIVSARHDEFNTPLIAAGCYDVVLAWDHLLGKAWLLSRDLPGREHLTQTRLKQFLDLLSDSDQNAAASAFNAGVPAELSARHELPSPEGLSSNFSRTQYLDAVQQCVDYIYQGDIFQVNLAQRLVAKANCSSVELYHRLRRCNPAPFAGFFDFGSMGENSGEIISASPERFVSIVDDRIETRPIKGTRKRTGRPMVDITVREQLKSSEKDLAENTMIVDLMRNDLSKICTDDSVKVTQFCEIEDYESVMHLVSAVEGKLSDKAKRAERVSGLLKAVFPGGSITGAPKVRAMEIIAELEPTARGAYCGSIGYFGFDGNVDLNILIRTITAGNGWWQIPVGGGIVSQSQPEKEYKETMTKAAGMLRAVFQESES